MKINDKIRTIKLPIHIPIHIERSVTLEGD